MGEAIGLTVDRIGVAVCAIVGPAGGRAATGAQAAIHAPAAIKIMRQLHGLTGRVPRPIGTTHIMRRTLQTDARRSLRLRESVDCSPKRSLRGRARSDP